MLKVEQHKFYDLIIIIINIILGKGLSGRLTKAIFYSMDENTYFIF